MPTQLVHRHRHIHVSDFGEESRSEGRDWGLTGTWLGSRAHETPETWAMQQDAVGGSAALRMARLPLHSKAPDDAVVVPQSWERWCCPGFLPDPRGEASGAKWALVSWARARALQDVWASGKRDQGAGAPL